jgi:hypothetical protein
VRCAMTTKPGVQTKRTRVFLSHREAVSLVQAVRDCLATFLPGAEGWLDQDITGGRWDERIRAELDASQALILVATPQTLERLYVGYEVGYVDNALGASGIFILRAGVEASAFRPPLSFFQNYGVSSVGDLAHFLDRLAVELGLPSPNLRLDELQKHRDRIARLIEAEVKRGEAASPAVQRKAELLAEAIEAQYMTARRHAVALYQEHLEPEVKPFDAEDVQRLYEDNQPRLDDQGRRSVRAFIGELRHYNELIRLASQDLGSPTKTKAQKRLTTEISFIVDPLNQAAFHVQRCLGLPERMPYEKF